MTSAVMENAGFSAAPDRPALPTLREDIHLLEGAPSSDGTPGWTIHDPVRNLFFRIGWLEFEILSRWHLDSPDVIVARVNKETTLTINERDVHAIARFLVNNNLVILSGTSGGDTLRQQQSARGQNRAGKLLQKFLFLRIPLVRPDAFLSATLPLIRFIYTKTFAWLMFATFLLGLFLTMRQWDSFTHTFSYLNSVKGLVWLIIALLVAKTAHELGHAYTAKRYGLRVPTMGVALLVFWPVLYTDCSEAWKLHDRRQRLAISAAGIGAELIIAVAALLLWSLLPDGPARSAIFVIATTSWLLTVLVNINPFVRFDGYYLLSDYLDTPNLQNRAFELSRWKLREWLFGLHLPAPGNVPVQRHHALVTYAWLTWAYRLMLFTGIGLLIYHLLFKLAGIFLLGAVVSWFVVRPVYLELQTWFTFRDRINLNKHSAVSLLAVCFLLLLLVVPWQTRISAPAIMSYSGYSHIYAPHPARLVETLIQPGDRVTEGQVLFLLESPELDHKHTQASRTIDMLNLQLARRSTHADKIEAGSVLYRELARTKSEAAGFSEQIQRLEIRSPVNGTVAEIADDLISGRWINESLQLALVTRPDTIQVEAFLAEEEITQVNSGTTGEFVPDSSSFPGIAVRVDTISQAALTSLENPSLASVYGGDIATHELPDGSLQPNHAIYRARLSPTEISGPLRQVIRGNVILSGSAQSIISRLWQTIVAVLIRESGF